MKFDINAWIRQPSTIQGLGVLAAGIGGALAHLATGNSNIDGIVAVLSYVLVHLGVDDHSVAEKAITAVAGDVIRFDQGAAPDTGKLISDALALVTALQSQTQPPAPPATPTPAA